MNYEVLTYKEYSIVVPEGSNGVPLDLALTNSSKIFITYGLPKKLKKYIAKKVKVLPEVKSHTRNFKALVQSPKIGSIMDIYKTTFKLKKELENEVFLKEGCYLMSLEEAKKYSEIFHTYFFVMPDDTKAIKALNSIGAKF